MISLLYDTPILYDFTQEIARVVKFMDRRQNGSCKEPRGGGIENYCVMGIKFQVCKMEKSSGDRWW